MPILERRPSGLIAPAFHACGSKIHFCACCGRIRRVHLHPPERSWKQSHKNQGCASTAQSLTPGRPQKTKPMYEIQFKKHNGRSLRDWAHTQQRYSWCSKGHAQFCCFEGRRSPLDTLYILKLLLKRDNCHQRMISLQAGARGGDGSRPWCQAQLTHFQPH